MPLARLSPDDPPARPKPLRRGEGPTTVEIFELCINGQEIAPGERAPGILPGRSCAVSCASAWKSRIENVTPLPGATPGARSTEQNNPIEQCERLESRACGTGGEQQKFDESRRRGTRRPRTRHAPPAGGIGIGIDRPCMMLLGQDSIRDMILFPQLKVK